MRTLQNLTLEPQETSNQEQKIKMFQYCFSREMQKPRKQLIYRALFVLLCTRSRSRTDTAVMAKGF